MLSLLYALVNVVSSPRIIIVKRREIVNFLGNVVWETSDLETAKCLFWELIGWNVTLKSG
jgi:hypothetical protein